MMRAPPDPIAEDRLIGREILGQYVITKRLGEGGMGAVYVADQPAVGRTAVVKVLSASGASKRDAAERFALEARAASRLNHPNIVTVYNAGELDDGLLFLAMEHVDGASLQEVLRREAPLSPARAVGIASQIASALAEAHRRGVVHRDLKPSNVMLVRREGGGELVKVLDFGIAKIEGVDLTQTGRVCGTPVYMSPEQFNGSDVDGRSDLYALGAVLFEMLAGRPPFVSDSAVGYMAKHLTETPNVPPSVPAPLAALILAALAKDPGDRPASLDAFRDALDRTLAEPAKDASTVELAVTELAIPTARAIVVTPAPVAQPPAPSPAEPPPSRAIATGNPEARSIAPRVAAAVRAALAWIVEASRAVWSRTGGRLFRKRPPTIGERVTGLLETVGLRRKRTWRERLIERANALFASGRKRR